MITLLRGLRILAYHHPSHKDVIERRTVTELDGNSRTDILAVEYDGLKTQIVIQKARTKRMLAEEDV
jgi:hypothetical protein